MTFGNVAKMPSPLLKQKFGIWGQQLWLFSNGLWNEPLLLEVKDRTTISSNTTLPCDEPDHESALTFTLSEATRLVGQFKPVRQIRIAFWNLARLDTQPTLWGRIDSAYKLSQQFGSTAMMTGAQLALREMEDAFKNPKAKCPFVPQREMVKKLWGTDADPLAHKGDWEKRLAKVSKQLQFRH